MFIFNKSMKCTVFQEVDLIKVGQLMFMFGDMLLYNFSLKIAVMLMCFKMLYLVVMLMGCC